MINKLQKSADELNERSKLEKVLMQKIEQIDISEKTYTDKVIENKNNGYTLKKILNILEEINPVITDYNKDKEKNKHYITEFNKLSKQFLVLKVILLNMKNVIEYASMK